MAYLKHKGKDSEVEVSVTDHVFTCHKCPLRLGRDFTIADKDSFLNHLLIHKRMLHIIPNDVIQKIKYGSILKEPSVSLQVMSDLE